MKFKEFYFPTLKKLFYSNLLFYFIGYLFIFSFTFFKIPLITHYFKPQELGLYAIISSALNYIDILFFSWISGTIWRYAYDNKFKSFGALTLSILPLLAVMAILAGISTFLLSFLFNIETRSILKIAFFSNLSILLVSIYLNYLLYKKQIKSWCAMVCFQSLFSLLILIFLVTAHNLSIESIFISTGVCNFIIIAYSLFINFKRIKIIHDFNTLELRKQVFTYSVFVTTHNIFLAILNSGDRFIIDYYKGKEKLGHYSQNYNLASVGLFAFIQFFNTVFMPLYSKNLSIKETNQTNNKIIQLYLLLFTPVLCFLLLNSTPITEIVLGKEFRGFSKIFDWVAVGTYFFGLSNFFEVRLKFLGNPKIVVFICGLLSIFNLVANGFLLKNNSIEMAAYVTFFSYFLMMILFVSYNWQFFLKLDLLRFFPGIFYATLICIFFTILSGYGNFSNWTKITLNALVALISYSILLKKRLHVLRDCVKKVSH